jgi:hypothetical protein
MTMIDDATRLGQIIGPNHLVKLSGQIIRGWRGRGLFEWQSRSVQEDVL